VFLAHGILFCLLVHSPGRYLSCSALSSRLEESNLDWIGESLAESLREALTSEGLMALNRDDRVEAYRRLAIRPSLGSHARIGCKIGEALDAEQ